METHRDGSSLGPGAFWMSGMEPDSRTPEAVRAMAALVERAARGESAAFEQIVIQHERRILRLAWRLLGEMDEAEDAAQEVFLRAFKYLHRFDVRQPIGPWLMRITVNVCRDLGRKRQAAHHVFAELESADAAPAGDEAGTPHAELMSRRRQAMLRAVIEKLPEKEKAAIILRDLEGLSTEEVAAVLKSSAATVRSQISSARLKIRKELDRIQLKETRP